MAINPKLCIQYEADASTITIKDDTGVYTVNDDGGYGTPNDDRNLLAGVLVSYYQPYDSDQVLLTDLENSVKYDVGFTNSEKSEFTISYFKDGWYKYIYTLVPTSITPEEGLIIYNTGTSDLRQYDDLLNLVPVYDITKLDDPLKYSTTKVEEIVTAKLNIKFNELGLEHFACTKCNDCDCDEEFDEVVRLLQGLKVAKSQFIISPYESQRAVERLTKLYKIK